LRRDAVAIVLLVLLITAFFADVLFFGTSLASGDITSYQVPLKKVVRDLVMSGEFPYWNRLLAGGQPVAANPAYEIFYPLQWFIFLPSFLLGFKLTIVVHFYLAAIGMFAFARALGIGRVSSFVAAIAYSLGGPLISLSGILAFLYSLAWLPWTFFFAFRFHRDGRRLDFALAALALAMQFLAGEPVLIATSVALLIIAALVVRRPLPAMAIVIAAASLSAVQLIPAIDHARDSARAIPLDFATVRFWSISFARPIDLFVAASGSHFLQSIYIGITLAVLAAAGLIARLRWWRTALACIAVSYVVALGDHTPLLRALYDARVFSSMRYPEKFLLPGLFVLVVFGAYALDELLRGNAKLRAIAVGVAAAAIVASVASLSIDAASRALVFAAIVWLIRMPRAQFALIAFAVVDVASHSARLLVRVPESFFTEPPPLVAKLPPPRERIFHELSTEREHRERGRNIDPITDQWLLRDELVAYLPAEFGRATALGIDFDRTALLPTVAQRLAIDIAKQGNPHAWPRAFMSIAAARYRVVPRDPHVAAIESGGDLARLMPADVVGESIRADRYAFASRVVPCRSLYECVMQMRDDQSVALVPANVVGGDVASGVVRTWDETPNTATIDVTAAGDAFLAMSVTFHKYWRATIDGVPVPIVPTNIAYQGVRVPRGAHRIRLEYRNPLLGIGAIVSLIAAIALAVYVGRTFLSGPHER
jgi:hypothetical protein